MATGGSHGRTRDKALAVGIRELAERAWRGELGDEVVRVESFRTNTGEDVLPGVLFLCTFGNVTVLDLPTGGLALVDCGGLGSARIVYNLVRQHRPGARVEVIVYTHGHVDHVMGAALFDKEAQRLGWPRPVVYAHRSVAARFDRYRLTRGFNEFINRRQFANAKVRWPSEYRYPDVVYDEALTLRFAAAPAAAGAPAVAAARVGVPDPLDLQLRHAKGETDDATWVFVPQHRLLCTGDLFVWVTPNCGNPQKSQRYPREWAAALRCMAALKPALLLPGHGPPILGEDRVHRALDDTARFLELLVEQTLRRMNTGETLEAIVGGVRADEKLLERPYLRPLYDEPEFILRNLWRLYGGWWSGAPDELKPARRAALARELAALVPGGPIALCARARALSAKGEHALACHLVEYAKDALSPAVDGPSPNATLVSAVHAARAAVYRARMRDQRSLMSRSIFREAYEQSSKLAEEAAEAGKVRAKL